MNEQQTTYRYAPIAVSDESTVVSEFVANEAHETSYQSEAELEKSLIKQLQSQAYEYLPITSEEGLIANLRHQLETLNKIEFSVEKAIGQIKEIRQLRYVLPKSKQAKTKILQPTEQQAMLLEMKI